MNFTRTEKLSIVHTLNAIVGSDEIVVKSKAEFMDTVLSRFHLQLSDLLIAKGMDISLVKKTIKKMSQGKRKFLQDAIAEIAFADEKEERNGQKIVSLFFDADKIKLYYINLPGFSDDMKKQIARDVEFVNKIMREVMEIAAPFPLPLPTDIKDKITSMLTGITPKIIRISNQIDHLSDEQMAEIAVPGMNGEPINIEEWLKLFGMLLNQIAEDIEY